MTNENKNKHLCLARDEAGNEIQLEAVEISRETRSEPGYTFARISYDYFLHGERIEPDDVEGTRFTIDGKAYFLVIERDHDGAAEVF